MRPKFHIVIKFGIHYFWIKINYLECKIILTPKPCNKSCIACPFVENTRTVKSTASNMTVEINAPISCDLTWVIYVVNYNKRGYGQQYVGKTVWSLSKRFSEHKGCVEKKMFEKATGYHFNVFLITEREREGMNRNC